MKKLALCLLIIFCLTGCDTNKETKDSLLDTLQREKIVDANLTLVDTETNVGTLLFITRTTYYIYKDSNNELIAINYDADNSSKNAYDYSMTIYSNVTVNNDVEYLEDGSVPESYYVYSDGKKTEVNKYDFSDSTRYLVYESKSLFSKTKYQFEEIK